MNKSETPTNKESELKKLLEEKRDKRVALEQKANEINSDAKKIYEEEHVIECELEKIKTDRIMKNIDDLIEVAAHTRTSCSDKNPCNNGDCPRCTLISAKKYGYWDGEYKLRFVIDNS